MALAIRKTEDKASVVVAGSVVTQDVYEKIETVEKVTRFTRAELERRKAEIEKELADINAMLDGAK